MNPPFYNDSLNELGFNPRSPPYYSHPLNSTPTSPPDLSPQISPPRNSTQTPDILLIIVNLISLEDESTSLDEKKLLKNDYSFQFYYFQLNQKKRYVISELEKKSRAQKHHN